MRNRSNGRPKMGALLPALLVLTACAGKVTTTAPSGAPSAKRQPASVSPLPGIVQVLLANQAAGRIRTIGGVGYVTAPIAVPLANGEVSLIPSTPDLEAALARLQRRWLNGKRLPLPYEAFQTAFTRLTAHRVQIGQAGGEALIRFATTDERGAFRFEQVPEGRWLLVADMSSPVSILLWAVPVEVGPEDPPLLFLVDGAILLEARSAR